MRALGQGIHQFHRRQDGAAMLMTLAFMALTIPLLMAALGLANTLISDAQVKKKLLRQQYSGLAVGEYVERLANDAAAWAELMANGGQDTVPINGETMTFAVASAPTPPGDHPDLGFQPFQTAKTVTPFAVANNVETAYTYTITVTNLGDAPEELTRINDDLRSEFTYVAGSTTGATTANPAISAVGQGGEPGDPTYNMLTWQLAPPVSVAAGEAVTLQFQATAKLSTGNYCNEAWVEPGERRTASGPAAKIRVGAPSTTLCASEAMRVTTAVDVETAASGAPTRYTYTINLTNNSSDIYHIKRIQDILPPGSSYVDLSTSGDLTALNPQQAQVSGRQRLTWLWSATPWNLPAVNPGQTRTLTFQAQATLARGVYWHEARIQFHNAPTHYSWPSGHVRIMDAYNITATDAGGQSIGRFQVWAGNDHQMMTRWLVNR